MSAPEYSGDLTNDEWKSVESLIPPAKSGGRDRSLNMRLTVNAIRYVLETECGWRNLPKRFPNSSSVRHYYDRWRFDGTWDKIQVALDHHASAEKKSG